MDVWHQQSSLVTRKAAICSDQALATSIGIDILKQGGNAADAAVSTMLAVSFIQPYSCGIGGDCHCLFYRAADKTIHSINGSGRTGKNITLQKVKDDGITDPQLKEWFNHGHWVSVPGTVAGMCQVVEQFGSKKVTLKQILEPVIKIASEGVPVPFKCASMWKNNEDAFRHSPNAGDLLIKNKSPLPGDIITAPKLANCLQEIAVSGSAEAFYCGRIAKNICDEVQRNGGALTVEDMRAHLSDPPSSIPSDAISVDFHGFRMWEMKPNTMGLVALFTLNVLKTYDLKALGHNSPEYIHIVAEATKHAYLKCWDYLCDPNYCLSPFEELLSEEVASTVREQINTNNILKGNAPFTIAGNTSYVAVVDEQGNGCSLVCSVSSNFGTGIIPDDCGFVMHDRAKYMSLEEKSNNAHGPYKLPLHSIIPAMVTDARTNDLIAVLGVIGRWMQPQGHVQVFLNMAVFGMDPQIALNQPRFFIGDPRPNVTYQNSFHVLCLEAGIDPEVVHPLQQKGHTCRVYGDYKREIFGKGHVIARSSLFKGSSPESNQGVWWSGADHRADSCAMGY